MRYLPLALILFVTTVKTVSASVIINEVAWMGDFDSANYEWIELHNIGSASINVDGWILSDGMNLSIPLLGSVSPGDFVVLERKRSDGGSVVGVPFLTYTGALVNTGATLVLKNSAGTIVDQVSGGENWQNIGGDNTTKETAQYTSQGWVTDVGTPGAVNGVGSSNTNTNQSTTTTTTTTKKSSSGGSKKSVSESVRLENLETKMVIVPDFQNVAYVNQPVPFKVKMTGVDDNRDKLVKYDWNFGDTYATSGKSVSHTYEYPGEYVVTVKGTYKNIEQVAQKEITVLPITFSLALSEAGDIQIHNNANYAVDISGYTLRGGKTIVLPPRSIILGKATITVSKNRVKKTNSDLIFLYDVNKNLVASLDNEVLLFNSDVPEADLYTKTVIEPTIVKDAESKDFTFIPKAEASEEDIAEEGFIEDSPIENEIPPSPQDERWTYFALIAVMLLAIGAIILSANKKTSEDNL